MLDAFLKKEREIIIWCNYDFENHLKFKNKKLLLFFYKCHLHVHFLTNVSRPMAYTETTTYERNTFIKEYFNMIR
jgi:hypothetical protein